MLQSLKSPEGRRRPPWGTGQSPPPRLTQGKSALPFGSSARPARLLSRWQKPQGPAPPAACCAALAPACMTRLSVPGRGLPSSLGARGALGWWADPRGAALAAGREGAAQEASACRGCRDVPCGVRVHTRPLRGRPRTSPPPPTPAPSKYALNGTPPSKKTLCIEPQELPKKWRAPLKRCGARSLMQSVAPR